MGVVEDRMILKRVREDRVSSETLCKVMTEMAAHVEEKIKRILLDKISLVFESWLCQSRYPLALSFLSIQERPRVHAGGAMFFNI